MLLVRIGGVERARLAVLLEGSREGRDPAGVALKGAAEYELFSHVYDM